MDHPPCHVIYINRTVGEDRLVRAFPKGSVDIGDSDSPEWKRDHVRQEVQPLLDSFGDVNVCATGASCISTLLRLQSETMTDLRPTLVLLDTPYDEPISEPHASDTTPSLFPPTHAGTAEIHTPDEDIYGLNLLQKIITEAHLRSMAKLVVPIPIISFPPSETVGGPRSMTDGAVEPFTAPLDSLAANRRLVRRCLDLGAVDVIISPLSSKCITTLEICAYKAHRDAWREQQALLEVQRGRKRSWVGVNEQKPFAYLREAMVSGLMNGICRVATDGEGIMGAHIAVSSLRQAAIADAVGNWYFSAHDFTDDELLVAAMLMFKHALAMPDLERWRIPPDQLISFLVACRTAYNNFVPYHNFRHVIDVMQATFNFLVRIGALPPYGNDDVAISPSEKSPLVSLLGPFESLTLLITAVGHDVGHPGVNNGFLTTLNAPLSQLYNDRSVLESFHCAAYSQILRRYWPAAFDDRNMRKLMISSILATDMGLHFDYMKKLGDVQERLHHNNTTDGWNGRQLEEQTTLACSLLIKCADISNVARHHVAAVQWMHILSEEFSRQAYMEEELEIKSSLFAPPKKDILSLCNAQLGFMNMFAIPLFQGVADVMPAMKYTVDELETNKKLFEGTVRDEKARLAGDAEERPRFLNREGTLSPRSRSRNNEAESTSEDLTSQETVTEAPKEEVSNEGEPSSHAVDEADSEVSPASSRPVSQGHLRRPHTPDQSNKMNGSDSAFDAVRDFASSDPFHSRARGYSSVDGKSPSTGAQRCSETTDGSASGAFTGDWASQATSATTGKMPVSPSTQGTSIVSGESMERPRSSAPGLCVSPPSAGSPSTLKKLDSSQRDEESTSTGSLGKADGKSLKKRPSRFRMRDFPFFRRTKQSSSPYAAGDSPS